MTKHRFINTAALGALALALGLTALPAQAQDEDQPGFSRGGNAERVERQPDEPRGMGGWAPREVRDSGGERPAVSPRQAPAPQPQSRSWGGAPRTENPVQRWERREARSEAPVAATAPPERGAGQRDGSYGAYTRGRDWGQRRGPDAGGDRPRGDGAWARPGERREGVRDGTLGNRSDSSHRGDWRERRDDARNYRDGYRDGRRDDNRWDNRSDGRWDGRRDGYRGDSRWGQDHRRWDHRRWRNDSRYDWYRYRAANRALFSLGRYYAPYRGYRYSRISIGFRLGSPFYSNRYWINDPWRYRLPAVYGPYRWVRYYDDALLVDIYSGEVVDVIYDFFW